MRAAERGDAPETHAAASRCRRFVGPLLLAACAGVASGCAPRAFRPPADPGTPYTDFAQAHADLVRACGGVRTLSAELALTGRAAGQRIRGRVIAGFSRPAAMRLEAVAPFGQPLFILAARGRSAVLLLPRDQRVVREAAAADILGAITGVTFGPADLQAILTGCVTPDAVAVSGRLHRGDVVAMTLADGATIFARRRDGGRLELRAAHRDGWQIEYPAWQGRFPSRVRLRSTAAPPVDVTATLTQLETNLDIPPEAFTVDVPGTAREMTVEDLREAGPLAGSSRE